MNKKVQIKVIIDGMKELKEVDDVISFDMENGKGIVIQLIDNSEGMEYIFELNDIEDDGWEPCMSYNMACKYGDMSAAKTIIEELMEV